MIAKEKKAIETVLRSYGTALVNRSAEEALTSFASDGVYMPADAPTSVGSDQVKGAFDSTFNRTKSDLEVTIDDIEVHGDIAIARTVSRATVASTTSEKNAQEESRELFVLKKTNEQWKISQHMFNKMSPPVADE